MEGIGRVVWHCCPLQARKLGRMGMIEGDGDGRYEESEARIKARRHQMQGLDSHIPRSSIPV